MAFPSVGAPTASQQTTNGTTSNVTLPASIAAGDLIIAVIAADSGAGAMTWPSPWVKLAERLDTAHVMSVGYLIASGGETSVAVTHTTERSNHLAWRITDWHGTTPPEASALANGNSNAPNPASLAPSWGADDTLWMALATWDDSSSPSLSTYPSNYTTAQGTNATASSAGRVAGAARQLNASSEDPGAFGLSGAETWAAFTVAICPAAAAQGSITGTATWAQAAASWSGTVAEKDPATATFAQAAATWAATIADKNPTAGTFAQSAASWDAAASEKFASTAAFTQAAPVWSASASVPAASNGSTATFVQAAASWSASASEKFPSSASFAQAAGAWAATVSEKNPSTATFAQGAASWASTIALTDSTPSVPGTATCAVTVNHSAQSSLSVTATALASVQ